MAFPRNSLRNFLIHAKTALNTAIEKKDKVTLVVGNESADLDSLTASLLYAYIRSTAPPSSAFTPLYIPLTNLPASLLRLRPEFHALLPHANLSPSHLITLDDLPPLSSITNSLPPENTRWILVDHNALQGQLGSIYSRQVAGVIDHHAEEHAVPEDTGEEPRIVTKAGSCTSLVTEYCADKWESLLSLSPSAFASHGGASGASDLAAQSDTSTVPAADDASRTRIWDAEVAKLALASILIDTYNLTDEYKVTPHDTAASTYLEAKIQLAPPLPPSTGAGDIVPFDRNTFFNEINDAKQSIDSLALVDIFEKDYKQWSSKDGLKTLGISSVVKPISFLLEKAQTESNSKSKGAGIAHFLETIRSFSASSERKLSVFAIMTAYTSPSSANFERELFVWSLDPDSVPAVEKFVHDSADQLRLEDWTGAGDSDAADTSLDHVPSDSDSDSAERTYRKAWAQKDLSKSRKQVAPLLRDAFS